jgi:tetratricopeptide (TPR) repeat protein
MGIEPGKAFFHRGRLRAQLEDKPGAVVDLDRAIAAHPEFAPAYLHRGNLLAELGEPERSEEDLRTATQFAPAIDPKIRDQ